MIRKRSGQLRTLQVRYAHLKCIPSYLHSSPHPAINCGGGIPSDDIRTIEYYDNPDVLREVHAVGGI